MPLNKTKTISYILFSLIAILVVILLVKVLEPKEEPVILNRQFETKEVIKEIKE